MGNKHITNYLNENDFCILVPVYNDFYINPSWRIVFTGSKSECENAFKNYPDFIRDNDFKKNLELLRREYAFILTLKNNKKSLNDFISKIQPNKRYLFNQGV